MSQTNTCFVISPIGEDGSDTRRNADDVFDLLVEPALQPFHFSVVRADKIPGPSSITEDVIRLVQESSLCVADLTDRNPNVFYECGRRHETGKPMILIIRKGDKIPFDLAGIRTISYDLSDPRKTRDCVLQMQEYVREIEKSGFAEASSGATLTTVIESLARIERKLNSIQTNQPSGATLTRPSSSSKAGMRAMLKHPIEAIHDALRDGNINELVDLLPRAERSVGYSLPLVTAAAVAAINGEKIGAEILARTIQSTDAKATYELKKAALIGLVQYYIGTDRANEGRDLVPQISTELLITPGVSVNDLAHTHNQLQMLFYAAADYQNALAEAEKAIALDSNEPAYFYNVSLVYEKLNLPKKAIEAIERCLAIGTSEAQHLSQAFDLYSNNGMSAKAEAIMKQLEEIDPIRAAHAKMQFE